jgi:hypothetical protein
MFAVYAQFSPAQWPPYSRRDIPRLPNGQPNLEAPTPRTADGKPDLSSVWEFVRSDADRVTLATLRPLPSDLPRTAIPKVSLDEIAPAAFRDNSVGFTNGLPLTPWAAEILKRRIAGNSKDNPDAHCLPMGIMQFHTHPQPRKIVQTPELLIIINEANYGLRQIFMDGRQLPNNDAEPWWYGYSVGRWEGDTLVVETTHFIDDGWLDIVGNPLSDAAKVIERFRRINYGNLEIDVTVEDPKAYTRPWTVKVKQRLMPDTQLIEFICQDKDAVHYTDSK